MEDLRSASEAHGKGLFRFRVVDLPERAVPGEPLMARYDPVFDTPLEGDDLAAAGAVASEARKLLEEHTNKLGHTMTRALFDVTHGPCPLPASRVTTCSHVELEKLSLWLASSTFASPAQKERWLGSTDTRGRLEGVLEQLRTRRTGALDVPGADSALHVRTPGTAFLLFAAVFLLFFAKANGLLGDGHQRRGGNQ